MIRHSCRKSKDKKFPPHDKLGLHQAQCGGLTNLVFVFSEIAFYIPLPQNHLCFEGQKYHQHDEYFKKKYETNREPNH